MPSLRTLLILMSAYCVLNVFVGEASAKIYDEALTCPQLGTNGTIGSIFNLKCPLKDQYAGAYCTAFLAADVAFERINFNNFTFCGHIVSYINAKNIEGIASHSLLPITVAYNAIGMVCNAVTKGVKTLGLESSDAGLKEFTKLIKVTNYPQFTGQVNNAGLANFGTDCQLTMSTNRALYTQAAAPNNNKITDALVDWALWCNLNQPAVSCLSNSQTNNGCPGAAPSCITAVWQEDPY